MAINMVIDIVDDKLHARHSESREYNPDLFYDIEGEEVNVWVDAQNVETDEIDDLVWVAVVTIGQNW